MTVGQGGARTIFAHGVRVFVVHRDGRDVTLRPSAPPPWLAKDITTHIPTVPIQMAMRPALSTLQWKRA